MNEVSDSADMRNGLLCGITAYTIWGLFPIYFILTQSIPALELLGHRIIWSVPFCLSILIYRKQLGDIITVLKNKRLMGLLILAAIAVAANWGVYIWAVQNALIFEASLGYYIMPLFYVMVGVIFFKERLSKLQNYAIMLAAIGVSILIFYGGVFPKIALFLGFSFTAYGIIKRLAAVRAMTGLFIETSLLFLPAVLAMLYFAQQGKMQFTQQGLTMDLLILFAGPLTVLPLLAFAFAARRIALSTLGVLQFIGPTLQFLCALYFGESLTAAHILCFAFIWAGVSLFAYDSLQKNRAIQSSKASTL